MEKVVINILYKNGVEDEFKQILETDEQAQGFLEMLEVTRKAMKQGVSGHITIGDEKDLGAIISVGEVARLKVRFAEGDSE